MRFLIILFVLCFSIMPISASEESASELEWWEMPPEKPEFTYDLFGRVSMVRGSSLAVGGGIDLGIKTDSFKFEIYTVGDYYLSPLGGQGGAALLEFSVEPGVTFSWKFMQVWRTRTYLGLDIGYFMQYAKIPQDPSVGIFLAHNGLMLRPKVVTEFQFAKHYNMSIGIYYQIPIFPAYDEYRGLGVMLAII